MATIQYARLYPDTTQLQAKDGHNLTAGWVEVYLAGTDDPAITYADFNGTRNPQKIVVDNNGRFCAIVDKSKAYRVEVYDADGALQWTTEPVWCTGNAGAGMSVTRVVSTDGSIAVEENIDGSERTYDISIAPSDSDEFLEWIKCSEEDCGSTWYPVYQAGTMETEAGQGIKVHAEQLYHFTNTFYVDPNGTGINYDTFKVMMYCNDEIVDVRDFDIDSSLNDSVMCEFSTDLIPEADGVVYYKLTIPSTCEVTAEVQCHRIYSGINAVPDTCATKQWVQETFDYNMSGRIPYSALGYDDNGDISGISGSAIAGGLDSAAVSSIASSYVESAVSSKIDWSSSGVFQPSGQYVYESAYSSFYSDVTNNISSLSSTVSGITADMSAYVPFSGLEGEDGKVTGISGSAIKSHEYTGINPVTVDNTADTISVEHRTLCVDSTMTAYNSGSSAVIGVNVAGLDLSSKMDASASSLFYPTSNPSGFITGIDLSPYQLTADMSAYAHESSLSAKLDASASSDFYSTSNPSGFITGVDLDPYVPFSSIEGTAGEVTGINGSAISVPDTFTGVHTDSSLTGNGLSSAPLGVERVDVVFDSSMTTAMSGDSIVIGVNGSALDLTAYQYASAMTAYQTTAGMSGYIPTSESANYYSTANPSGFLTGVDLSPYQLTADMSGYQVSGDYAYNSSVSAKLDASASSEFQPSGDYYSATNPSGFVGSAYVDSSVSGKLDASASADFMLTSERADYLPASASADLFTGVETDSSLTGNGLSTSPLGVERVDVQFVSGLATGMSGDMIVVSADNDYYSGYATTAYVDSSVSGKLDASASSDFYGTANPSGFIDGASASAIASAYQVVSATATQLNAGTSYLTSVNETPLSAARAGNAANASLANSAWYDGTGRMISSLPDETTVSGIASAYAESAVSGKLDESASSNFYSTSNPSGFITGIDLTPYQLTADMSGYYTTANESGYVDSAYVESQVSGKQDTLTFDWDADSAISSINGSALVGGGGASIPFTGVYWDSAESATANITADVLSVSSRAYTKYNGTVLNAYKGIIDSMGITHLGVATFIDAGAEINRDGYTLAFAPSTSMWTTADDATGIFSPLRYGTGAGMFLNNGSYKGYLKGNEWFVSNTAYGYVRGEVHQTRGCRVIAEHTGGAVAALSATGSDANVTLTNTAYGTAKMAVANSQAYVQVQRGNQNYKYNSAKLDTDYLKFYNSMTTGYIDPEDTASGTAYMPAETEYMYISSIPYWNAKLDASAIECDTASAITAIGGSAIAGGGGGVDSATVSAIASAYVESGVSGKLDTTAQVVTSIDETYPATGGTFISRINGTDIFAVTAGSASDWVGASSKVDQTAYDNLYSAFTALSDIISTYSAYFSSISAKVDNSAIGVSE